MGEMVIENVFEPDRIVVKNLFQLVKGVCVRRAVQRIPFTRDYQRIVWKLSHDGSEICRIMDCGPIEARFNI